MVRMYMCVTHDTSKCCGRSDTVQVMRLKGSVCGSGIPLSVTCATVACHFDTGFSVAVPHDLPLAVTIARVPVSTA